MRGYATFPVSPLTFLLKFTVAQYAMPAYKESSDRRISKTLLKTIRVKKSPKDPSLDPQSGEHGTTMMVLIA